MLSIENINNKRPYIPPAVTAVVFRTERGYASSGDWVSHAANNLNAQIGTALPDMGFWAQPDQKIYGTNTGAEDDDNLAAGEFYFYNTNADDGGWF